MTVSKGFYRCKNLHFCDGKWGDGAVDHEMDLLIDYFKTSAT